MYGRMDLSHFDTSRSEALSLDRRNFVRLALGTGAGLVIGRATTWRAIFGPGLHCPAVRDYVSA